MSIKDNPYFKIVPSEPFMGRGKDASEILSGDFWSVRFRDDCYILDYISGEHAGRAKSLEISTSEFELLRDGKLSIDHILARHHTN